MELIFWGIVVSACSVFLWFYIRQDLTEGLEDELDGFSSILDNNKKAKPKPKVKRTNINQSKISSYANDPRYWHDSEDTHQSYAAFDEIVDAIDESISCENHSSSYDSIEQMGVRERNAEYRPSSSMNDCNHDMSPSYSSSSSYDSSSSYSGSSSDSGGF